MWLRSKNDYSLEEFNIIFHCLSLYYNDLRNESEEEKKVEILMDKIQQELLGF